jgi:hypothetical protein
VALVIERLPDRCDTLSSRRDEGKEVQRSWEDRGLADTSRQMNSSVMSPRQLDVNITSESRGGGPPPLPAHFLPSHVPHGSHPPTDLQWKVSVWAR